jgi:predicted phosphodiesterase
VQWFTYYLERMKNPEYVAYTSLEDFAYQLPQAATGGLRIGLVGDWGTGEGRAIEVLTQLFALKPDFIIHLGDVYYSGTEHEYEVNYHAVIDQVRKASGAAIPVYNLPGNHDYYSGGHAFYQSLKTVNVGATPGLPIQEASYFALFNDAWHIQGMDTGYYDNDVLKVGRDTTHLVEEEVKWHQHQLDKALAAGRKVILLSHHQLFSRYLAIADQPYNADLLGYFQQYIQPGNICAWFWGHEHLGAVYQPYLGLAKGRCLGHGAVPIFYDGGEPYAEKASVKGIPLPNLPEVVVAPEAFKNDGNVYFQGFALLELQADQTGQASYYTTDQLTPIYQETLC